MTRRDPGEGTWRATPTGWLLSCRFGVGPDGRRRRKAFAGRTKAECRERRATYERRLALEQPTTSSEEGLGLYLERWLLQREPYLRPRTVSAYQGNVAHIRSCLAAVSLADLTPQHVERMLVGLVKRGLSATTANHARTVLGTALRDAQRSRPPLVTLNAAQLARPLPAHPRRLEPLTEAQVGALLAALRLAGSRLWPLFTVAARLGLRQGELLALQWPDVDLEERTVTVRHTLRRAAGVAVLDPPKTRKGARVLPLTDELVEVFRQQRERQELERLYAGRAWAEWPYDLVFRTDYGGPVDGRSLTKQFQRALAGAGLPRQRFHDLRHAAATHLLARGVDLALVQAILGHASVAVTANVYAHVRVDDLRRALDPPAV